jgi:hypothetical protein
MEITIRVRRAARVLGIAFLVTLDIGTVRAAEAQASLPPAPPRRDAEMAPTKIPFALVPQPLWRDVVAYQKSEV